MVERAENYRMIPLTFEKGTVETVEESVLPAGAAPLIQNWVPEPGGNLRSRLAWRNCSVANTPMPRICRGIGVYTSGSTTQPALVQWKTATGYGNNPNITFDKATTAGNLILVAITAQYVPTNHPAGWTALTFDNSAYVKGCLAYRENAPATTSYSGTWPAYSVVWTVRFAEFSGVDTTSVRDLFFEGAAIYTNPSTEYLDISTGTSGSSDTPQELALALWFGNHSYGLDSTNYFLSGPSNGFTRVGTNSYNPTYYPVAEIGWKVSQFTGTHESTVRFDQLADGYFRFAPGIVSFRARPVASSSNFYAVAQDAGTSYTIHVLDRADLDDGTWSQIDAVTVTAATEPVCFTMGLGYLFYSNRQFASIRRWNGTTASALPGGPPGRTIAFHKNRLFAAGTDAHPDRLYFSELGDPTTWPALNYLDVNLGDGEPIEEINVFNNMLLIGKQNSLWVLSGSGPDSFVLQRLPDGGVAPGRTIMPSPYGAVIAGRNRVWLVTDDAVDLISRPIENSYGMTGSYMSTSYMYGSVYICDSGSGVVWVINLTTGTWHKETAGTDTDDNPIFVYNYDNEQLYGPRGSETVSLAAYRHHPAGSREPDAFIGQTFRASTAELWAGPQERVTPRHLFLALRQRGTRPDQAPLVVTPYFQGIAQPEHIIWPGTEAGTRRERLDLGGSEGIDRLRFEFSQDLTTDDEDTFDIEQVQLGALIEEIR